MACPAGGSCCSLQARLHHLEAARAAEMHAHGMQVRELQREADASAESEKQLRLELARLRTDRCRLEAEAAAASRRTQQALEAADAQRDAHSKVVLEKEAKEQESQRLAARLREELAGCQHERQHLAEERVELRMTVETLRQDAAALRATGEERLQAIQAQAAEIGRLGAVAVALEHELAAVKLRYQLQEQELASARSALEKEQRKRCDVERALEHALQTRNRVITWRRGWVDALHRDLTRRELFVAWKAMLLDAMGSRNEQAAAANEATRHKLRGIGDVLRAQCARVRDDLVRGKTEWERQQVHLEALRHQVMAVELPKLLAIAARVQDRSEMTANEALSSCAATREEYRRKQQGVRDREDALVGFLARWRSNAWRTRVFSRWKDWHLRNVIGETTHAAMVSRVPQPISSAGGLGRDSSEGRGYEADVSETRTLESTVDSSQASDSSLASAGAARARTRSSTGRKLAVDASAIKAGAMHDDGSWQRWRRVAASGSAPPRRSRVLLRSPSPTRDISSPQPRRNEQR